MTITIIVIMNTAINVKSIISITNIMLLTAIITINLTSENLREKASAWMKMKMKRMAMMKITITTA